MIHNEIKLSTKKSDMRITNAGANEEGSKLVRYAVACTSVGSGSRSGRTVSRCNRVGIKQTTIGTRAV